MTANLRTAGIFDQFGDLIPVGRNAARAWTKRGGNSIVEFVQGAMGHNPRDGECAYNYNPIFNLGIEAIWRGFSRLPLEWWTGNPKDEDTEWVEGAPLAALFDAPRANLSSADFWELCTVEYKAAGAVFWFLADADGNPIQGGQPGVLRTIPAQIIPVPKWLVEEERVGASKAFKGLKYKRGAEFSPVYPLESVVCVGNYRPGGKGFGIGAEEVLSGELAAWDSAAVGMEQDLAATDGGAFIVHPNRLTPDQAQMAQAQAEEMAADEARYKILSGDPKVIANPIRPADKGYSEIRTDVRDVILAKLGVPPNVVGFQDNATYENLRTSYKQLWRGPLGIVSMARVFQNAINELQRRLFNGGQLREVLFPWFSTADIPEAQDDASDKIRLAAEIAAKGIGVSFNDASAQLGIEVEATPNGDRILLSNALGEVIPVDPDADESDPPKVVLGALQASKVVEILQLVQSGSMGPETAQHLLEAAFGMDPLQVAELVESIEINAQEAAPPLPSDPIEVENQYQARAKSDFVKPDRVLKGRAVSWLRQLEREQIRILREIAKGKRDVGDIVTRGDKVPTESEWKLLLFAREQWEDKLAEMSLPSLRRLFRQAVVDTAQELAVGPINVTDPRIVAAFTAQSTKLAKDVTGATEASVRNVILKAFAGVDNEKPLQVALAEVLPELEGNLKTIFGHKERRGATIARTETGKAQNTARFVQYEAAGVTHLEWRISPSGDHRESHYALDGVEVPLGERFANGLRHPHEEGAPAAEAINCRCRVVGHFRDNEEGDDQ